MRRRAGCWLGLGVVLVAVAASQVGFSPPDRFVVRRADGSPAGGVLVAFRYRGDRFNLVDSIGYERPGRLVRADAAGVVEIPPLLYRKAPLDGYLRPWVALLYDPGSQFAAALGEPGEGTPWLEAGPGAPAVVLAERGAHPAAWERSLDELHSFVAYELVFAHPGAGQPRVAASPSEVRELARAVGREYRALLARHGEAPREPPPIPGLAALPVAERAATLARIEADLREAPLWRDHLVRVWPARLEQLDAAVAELP